MVKMMIRLWRQSLVFIHEIMELQGMQGIEMSQWKYLKITHRTIPSVPKASDKFLRVIRTHKKVFTATRGLRLRPRGRGGHPKVI